MNYSFTNLIAAIVLSISIIFGWQFFFVKPKLNEQISQVKHYNEKKIAAKNSLQEQHVLVDRSESISASPRIKIASDALSGSIALKGLRLDDLSLTKYKQKLSEDSPVVALFSPANTNDTYFAEIGWLSNDGDVICPDASTIWSSDINTLNAHETVNLYWTNPQGVKFSVAISLDDNYLFTIKQSIKNSSSKAIAVKAYGLINRSYDVQEDKGGIVNMVHQGMIGVMNGQLQEYSYAKMKEEKRYEFGESISWLGVTDKYWLAAFIPDRTEQYNANYNFAFKGNRDKYQADFTTKSKIIEKGGEYEITHRLFAGAKKVSLLDKYEQQLDIKLFDRAIDFGWFYILTKPIFSAMNYFYGYVGNFGLSIMIVTVLVKLAMFTLASKSYQSMKKMKKLQPEMARLKELYGEDKTLLNQEVMTLYKREKVNPVSGCLPMLIQIPVFFSIYKVLCVTIEMRHAPFFGWIRDLSGPDPTTIFNLFGLLPFTPPVILPLIGVLPIFMAITMFLQQKMSPQSMDPVQAQVMKFMPLVFLFMFSNFPAGLLIYWSWNNILSIIQQLYIK